ncbi:MAG: hypothetical protein H6640_03865 [Caldilineaceae bacterium]|nr:hypothetical protein [Caldilineaceae bacterium]
MHIEHGIGKFEDSPITELGGISRVSTCSSPTRAETSSTCPCTRPIASSRYVGSGDITPPVNRLGTADWRTVKERAKRASPRSPTTCSSSTPNAS